MLVSKGWRAALLAVVLLAMAGAASASFYVSSGDTVWRVDDLLTTTQATQNGFGEVTSLATQPNGSVLIGMSGQLQRWETNLAYMQGSANFGDAVTAVVAWPDSTVAAGASNGEVVRMNDAISQTIGITGGAGIPSAIAVMPDGSFVVSSRTYGEVYHLDANITTGHKTGGYGELAGLDTTSDSQTVIGGSGLNMVWRLDPTCTFFTGVTGGFPGLSTIEVGLGDVIYIGCLGDTLYALDPSFGFFIAVVTGVGSITAMDIMADGSVLVGNAAGTIARYSPDLSSVLGQMDMGVPISFLASETVPEPASMAVLGAGLAGLIGMRRRLS